MLDLKVEHVEDSSKRAPPDCYISVRVGDTQKLSKLSQERIYRFPQTGEVRFGKIEVFQRIGHCNIDVDPRKPGIRDVKINVAGPGGPQSLDLRVDMDADEGLKRKAPEQVDAAKKGNKAKAAKEYLNKHGLENKLGEAMAALLRDRPEDPAIFIAEQLLMGCGRTLSGAAVESKPAARRAPESIGKAPFAPLPAERRHCEEDARQCYWGLAAAVRTPDGPVYRKEDARQCYWDLAAAAVSKPAEAGFIKEDARQCYWDLAAALRKPDGPMYRKEDSRQCYWDLAAAARTPDGPVYLTEDSRQCYWDLAAAVRKPGEAVRPASKTSIEETASFVFKPSVASWLAPARTRCDIPAVAAAPKQVNFEFKPSVASWLAPARTRFDIPAVAAPEQVNFVFKPSVASWLAPARTDMSTIAAPKSVEAALERSPLECKQYYAANVVPLSGVPLSDLYSTSAATASKAAASEETPFVLKPSVGTWLTPARCTAPTTEAIVREETSFALRPSVATWLRPLCEEEPHAVETIVREISEEAAAVRIQAQYRGKHVRKGGNNDRERGEDLRTFYWNLADALRQAPSVAPTWAFASRPSVGTWLVNRRPLCKEEVNAAEAIVREESPFALRPSVATWLRPLCEEKVNAAEAIVREESPFALRPSVAAWLRPLCEEEANAADVKVGEISEEAAAVRIQAQYRGKHVRRGGNNDRERGEDLRTFYWNLADALRQVEVEGAAAVRIQAQYRGKHVRKGGNNDRERGEDLRTFYWNLADALRQAPSVAPTWSFASRPSVGTWLVNRRQN